MESKFKKILLQSTVFTCLSSGVTVTMGLDPIRETEVVDGYIDHHRANFADIANNNPAMAAIKAQQLVHRDTVMTDVTLMLDKIKSSLSQTNADFEKLIKRIGAALTADADAINDIEDRHEAKTATETAETLLTKANLYKGAMTKTDTMFGDEGSIKPDFKPGENITRAEAAVMIARMHGYKDSDASSYTNSFVDDVPATHWAVGPISYLKTKSIVSGITDTTFNPDDKVTKAQMAVMIAKANGYIDSYVSTTDINIGTSPDWATKYIQYAIDKGFMSTSTSGYDAEMTRADVATMVAKAAGYTTAYTPVNNLFSDVDAAAYISYLADKDIIRVKRSETNSTIQHYRLAYFLMLKLQPWLADNYNVDPIEADELLKDHIPTHYPEWISTQILQKKLAVELVGNTVKPIEGVTVSFPLAKTILTGTKVYKYNGTNGTEVSGASVESGTNKLSAKISGLTAYGVYYVEIGTGTDADPKHKYYFSVKNTTVADQFVYGDTVKVKSTPNDGLKALANSKEITPKLTLKLNGTAVDESTFTANLDGGTTWKKLLELSSVDFLKTDQTIYFNGLGAGDYTFEVGSPTPQRFAIQSASFTVLPQIISPTATAANRDYKAGDTSATPTLSQTMSEVNINRATFDDASVGTDKEVTVYFGFSGSIAQKNHKNYLLVPQYSTTANITQPVTTTTTPAPTPTPTPTIRNGTLQKRTITTTYPATHQGGSPTVISEDVITVTGTVENITAGTYTVSIISASNPSGAGTIVVSNGSFYVPLDAKTFNSNESVTVTITAAGTYSGKSFTFNAPTIAATFGNASSGSGTVTFSGLGAFNGETASLTSSVTEITGYSSITAIANGEFTATYTTSALAGSIAPAGTIFFSGTGFTFN